MAPSGEAESRSRPRDRTAGRVVVYRLGSIGDTPMVPPALRLLRQAFPGTHITLRNDVPVAAKAAPTGK